MREARLVSFAAHEPPTGERSVLERPPEGLARGVIPTSGIAVLALTLVLVLIGLGYYALRLRKARPR